MKSKRNWINLGLAAVLAVSLSACSSVDLAEGTANSGAGSKAMGTGAAGTDTAQSQRSGGSDVQGVELKQGGNTGTEATQNLGKVIYFDYDSFALKDEFAPLIASYARALSTDRTTRLLLAGHTDERGSREYNLALGQQRAEAVKRALLLLGAQELQVEAISYGEEKPASVGGDEVSYAKNRRVEITAR